MPKSVTLTRGQAQIWPSMVPHPLESASNLTPGHGTMEGDTFKGIVVDQATGGCNSYRVTLELRKRNPHVKHSKKRYVVWVAETSESGEKMTIILQNMPREYAQNMRAARIVSKISSAHVVQVHGVAIIPNLRMGFTGIVPAPLLEYCPYGTVWDLLKGRVWRSTASYNPSRGCIRLQQAYLILAQLASALSKLADKRWVHLGPTVDHLLLFYDVNAPGYKLGLFSIKLAGFSFLVPEGYRYSAGELDPPTVVPELRYDRLIQRYGPPSVDASAATYMLGVTAVSCLVGRPFSAIIGGTPTTNPGWGRIVRGDTFEDKIRPALLSVPEMEQKFVDLAETCLLGDRQLRVPIQDVCEHLLESNEFAAERAAVDNYVLLPDHKIYDLPKTNLKSRMFPPPMCPEGKALLFPQTAVLDCKMTAEEETKGSHIATAAASTSTGLGVADMGDAGASSGELQQAAERAHAVCTSAPDAAPNTLTAMHGLCTPEPDAVPRLLTALTEDNRGPSGDHVSLSGPVLDTECPTQSPDTVLRCQVEDPLQSPVSGPLMELEAQPLEPKAALQEQATGQIAAPEAKRPVESNNQGKRVRFQRMGSSLSSCEPWEEIERACTAGTPQPRATVVASENRGTLSQMKAVLSMQKERLAQLLKALLGGVSS